MAISIIVPAYKAERTIGACLEALLRQKPNDCEIIVVADDESREAIRALAEPRGARVLTPNHGAAAARNLGAENARGDLVLFVDADCVPEKNWIQAMTAPFADPQIVGAGGMKQTKQRGIVPRFIQMEFDYRYDNERNLRYIDFADGGWQPDTYRDDMSLVVETQGDLTVICGCCHAGLLNTLACVHQVFQRPIVTIIGGTHLIDADATQLQHVIEVLQSIYGSPRLYLNHCTGERAYIALTNAFGDQVKPFPAGTVLDLG